MDNMCNLIKFIHFFIKIKIVERLGAVMEFRPCIDIHNGKVKQIVGGTLRDEKNQAEENFVSKQDAASYASLYKEKGLKGGHVILLNAPDSAYFAETKRQAFLALGAYPGGLQAGGGIHAENAAQYIDAGASHVIVTSYVFSNGEIHYGRLKNLCQAVGKERVVLDLSCKRYPEGYVIMTDRWQKKTGVVLTEDILERLSAYCDEFLVHAVDVEGKSGGVEEDVVRLLGQFTSCPVTYAGGVHSMEDLSLLKRLGNNHVNVTIGSALDLFGGSMSFGQAVDFCKSAG